MKHTNSCERKIWHADGGVSVKANQETEIRKMYPNYRTGDYVLWVVMELFCKYKVENVYGQIDILKKDGQVISGIESIVRKPYPNKRIYHIGTKLGRKRVYGIPLVFKSFEDMSEIMSVRMRWDIESVSLMNDSPFDLCVSSRFVDYDISFLKPAVQSEDRIYTIFSKEYMYWDEKLDVTEYEHIFGFEGVIILHDESVINDIYDRSLSDGEEKELTEIEHTFLEQRCKEDKNDKYLEQLIEQHGVTVTGEIQWNVEWYRMTEELKPAYMADHRL